MTAEPSEALNYCYQCSPTGLRCIHRGNLHRVDMSIHLYDKRHSQDRLQPPGPAQRPETHPRESYNEVIGRLVDMAVDEEPLSDEAIRDLERSLEDLRAGRVYTLDEVMAELKGE